MNRPASLKNLSHFYVSQVTAYEASLMERFCSLRSFPWVTWIFKTFSRLGDGSLWVATGIFLVSFDDDHLRRIAFCATIAVVLSVLLFMCVKKLIGRHRPYESWNVLTCLMAPPDKFSFPSGHTMTAFAVWGTFSVGMPMISNIYLCISILIGLSRIFLGLHYPTDVIVGAILGGSIGYNLAKFML